MVCSVDYRGGCAETSCSYRSVWRPGNCSRRRRREWLCDCQITLSAPDIFLLTPSFTSINKKFLKVCAWTIFNLVDIFSKKYATLYIIETPRNWSSACGHYDYVAKCHLQHRHICKNVLMYSTSCPKMYASSRSLLTGRFLKTTSKKMYLW